MPTFFIISVTVTVTSQVNDAYGCLNRFPTRLTADLETLKRASRYEISSEQMLVIDYKVETDAEKEKIVRIHNTCMHFISFNLS